MAETIFFNGKICSFHGGETTCPEAVFVKNGKIQIAGNREDVFAMKNNETQLVDLQGRTMLPGFHDAHIHVWKVGNLLTRMLDLRGVKSIAEIQQKLKDFRAAHPGISWINARGFNEASMLEKRLPNRFDLDEAVPDIPVFVQRTCAHISVANSKALEIGNLKFEPGDLNAEQKLDPRYPKPNFQFSIPGGAVDLDENGVPLGILRETAQGLVQNALPKETPAELREMVLVAQNALLEKGITSATDPAVAPDLFQVYQQMAEAGELKIRIHAFPILLPDGGCEPLPLPEIFRSGFFIADTVKFFADGGLSGRTAALSRPYLPVNQEVNNRGILRLDEKQYLKLATDAAEKGWGIATHAIGDRAIDLVVRVYKKLRKRFPGTPLRIEHLGLPNRRHLRDLHLYNIGVATQPVFLDELGGNFVKYLNMAFLKRTYPVRSLLELGISTAFSSDAPVVRDFGPMKSVACAMLRKTASGETIAASEAINLTESLRAFTVGSAELSGNFVQKGSILPGFAADFVVLAQNPFEAAPEDLPKIEVLETWVDGISRFK